MSQASDLISNDDDLPLNSPATISDKYTDEESPSYHECHQECHHEHGHDDWETMSKMTHNLPGPSWGHICPHGHHHHHHFEYEPDYNECQHGHEWSNVTMSDDEIEIVTDPNYYRHVNEVFYIDQMTARSLLSDFLIREPTGNLHIHVDRRSKRQRLIARVVMITSMTMFTVSVLMVMVSLIMSDHIDDMGKLFNYNYKLYQF